jgi:transposase InsO family protein
VSTVGQILKREGLVKSRRPRRRRHLVQTQLTQPTHANHVWAMDYKGQFRLGSKRLCYPFTSSDIFSRFIVCCDSKESTAIDGTRVSLEAKFREYGMPEVARSDNGEPFAGHGLGGLNRFSVWLMRLGIRPERIAPGHPEQNPEHERMHRELKADTARPPARTEALQQLRFDEFRSIWNHERPHEALGQVPPARLWQPSPRRFPEHLPQPEYDGHLEVRRVRSGGEIKFKGSMVFISQALVDQRIGLEEVDDGTWSINFMTFEIGRLDERNKRTYG